MSITREEPRDITPSALDAAIEVIERGLRSDGAYAGGIEASDRAGAEWRALVGWCAETGRLVGPQVVPDRVGGREHDVRFDLEQRRWVKFTKWNCAGFTVDLETDQPLFLPATPLQYLRRLKLQNAVFGDDLRLLGVQTNGHDRRIITDQPDVVGEAPTIDVMSRLLSELHGFAALGIPPMGYYKSLSFLRGNIGLFDAHPANCVITPDGEFVPIDFMLVEFDSPGAELLLRSVQSQPRTEV